MTERELERLAELVAEKLRGELWAKNIMDPTSTENDGALSLQSEASELLNRLEALKQRKPQSKPPTKRRAARV